MRDHRLQALQAGPMVLGPPSPEAGLPRSSHTAWLFPPLPPVLRPLLRLDFPPHLALNVFSTLTGLFFTVFPSH